MKATLLPEAVRGGSAAIRPLPFPGRFDRPVRENESLQIFFSCNGKVC